MDFTVRALIFSELLFKEKMAFTYIHTVCACMFVCVYVCLYQALFCFDAKNQARVFARQVLYPMELYLQPMSPVNLLPRLPLPQEPCIVRSRIERQMSSWKSGSETELRNSLYGLHHQSSIPCDTYSPHASFRKD